MSAVSKLATATNNFALDLYSAIAKDAARDDQIFFSPFSVTLACAMAYLGARGDTAQQMEKALHFSEVKEIDLHKTFHSLNAVVNTGGGNSYMMHIANRIFTNDKYDLLQSYLTETRNFYQAEAQKMNFGGDADGARQAINGWVEKQTCGKIKDLLPSGIITAATALVLVNALYFKAEWEQKFKSHDTYTGPFFISGNEIIDVEMMFQKTTFRYSKSAEYQCQALTMPYKNDDLAMVIMLPAKESSLITLESHLSPQMLKTLMDQGSMEQVLCYIPKFKFDDSIEMNQLLSSLGMSDLFSYGKADLSGIDGTHELFVSKVIHKAFVEVNEEGTEAAAATAMVMTFGCAPSRTQPEEFRADRPFLFLIRDNRTGAIVFMGRVTRPTLSQHQ